MRILGLILVAAAILSHCGGSSVPAPAVQNRKPDTGPPNFHFDAAFPDTMEFEQGYAREFNVLAMSHVPEPKSAVVTAENLPTGVKFDGQILSWTPDCGASAYTFQHDVAEFSIRFTLKAAGDDVQYIQRRVGMRVFRFFEGPGRLCGDPQWRRDGFDLSTGVPAVYFDRNFPDSLATFQGSNLTYDLMASAHAFPVGGLTMSIAGLPSDASFDGQYLTWKPACSDDPALYVSRKRSVQLAIRLIRNSDSTQYATRMLDIIAHQTTPCTSL
jgi:hypothetical protein